MIWRAVTRERRDYARFKRLRSTALRRKVFRRWIIESWLMLGGLAGVVLLAAGRSWRPPWPMPARGDRSPRSRTTATTVTGVLAGLGVATVLLLVVPILLLRRRLDEVPAIGDIRAILPRNRGELPYGAALGLTAGIVEELLFRLALPALLFGVLQGIPDAGALAFGLSALLFGALHLYQGPLGILFSFVLGSAVHRRCIS